MELCRGRQAYVQECKKIWIVQIAITLFLYRNNAVLMKFNVSLAGEKLLALGLIEC